MGLEVGIAYAVAGIATAVAGYTAYESAQSTKKAAAAQAEATEASNTAASIKARQSRLAALRSQQKARASVIAASSAYGGNVQTSGEAGVTNAMTTAGDINSAFTNQISTLNSRISSSLADAAYYNYKASKWSSYSNMARTVGSLAPVGYGLYTQSKSSGATADAGDATGE